VSKILTLTLSNGPTLHFNTPAEEAAIAAGMAQDPDTHGPSASEIAAMKRPGRPFGSGNKTQVTLRLDTAALDAFKATGPGWHAHL